MLAYYAGKFPTVEINNTFYQLPKEKVLLDWAAQVPEQFSFCDQGEPEDHALCAAQAGVRGVRRVPGARNRATRGPRRPNPVSTAAESQKGYRPAARIPRPPARGRRYAMEFRHASWFDDDQVFDALREHNVRAGRHRAGRLQLTVHATASWGYLRLHRLDYDAAALTEWAKRVNANGWKEAYVFFKHDHVPTEARVPASG